MKRFLKTILLYAAILCAITVFVNKLYIQARPVNDITKFEDVPHGIQISNFGSSHGLNGFNYIDVDEKACFNFALGGQSPSYDYRIMKNYINHMEGGGIAFLPISYFSLFGPAEPDQSGFLSKNKRYYNFLPKELIKEYDSNTMFFVRYFPALATDGADLFTTLFFHPVEIDLSAETTPADAAEHAPRRYQTHVKNFLLDKHGNRIYNQEEISAVYEMIQLCKDNNIEPVLITTPFLAEYSNEIQKNDPLFFRDFYGLISEICSETGVRYYDYSLDERFSSSYHLFFNTDHLNTEGARQFTNILIEETLGK